MNKLNTIILLLSINAGVMAIDWNSPTGKKGYWNYEINPNPITKTATIEQIPKAPLPTKLPPTEQLMQMHPDQIQFLVKSWRKHAVYTLQPADVSEALRIQDVARRKASAYAAVVGLVNQQNPNLTLADEIPITNAGKQSQYNQRKLATNNYIEKYKNNYGLLYFTSQTCEYCRVQDSVLQQFLNQFDYQIKSVELERQPLLAAKFNVQQTPTIIIANQRTKKWIPVTFGATSLPKFKENVYRGIRYIQQEITPAQFFTNEKDIGTGLDPVNKQIR